MTDRVHASLDGELARLELSDAERARLSSIEASLGDVVSTLREVPTPDITWAVMRRLPTMEPAPAAGALRRLAEWFWTPRPFTLTLRPAYGMSGFAALAFAAVLLTGGPAAGPIPVPPNAAAVEAQPRLYVQFRLQAAGASRVELAGSFTEWQPTYHLEESEPGVWSVMVPLDPGVHDYTFVVDGSDWVIDPHAPTVDDSFGGSNSRLFLPNPTGVV
jgi:hypothetical protein